MDCSEIITKVDKSIGKIIAFNPKIKKTVGSGTGFVFSKSGIVVTCNHVIERTDVVYFAKFPSSDEYIPIKILLRDEEHDLALLEVKEKTPRTPLEPFSGPIREGQEVMFSGYPLGLKELTTHQGIISSISKDATGITTYLIDGTVNPGNSGCPLISNDGKVIGVVNAQIRENADILEKVEEMKPGAIAIHDVDLIDIYKALMRNLQLGIGYAIPASYIPSHKAIEDDNLDKGNKKKTTKLRK